jgi:hypothetical protein
MNSSDSLESMATGQANKLLTGAVGEFLVAAELCRRGLLATPFAGNVPHYDIIASGQRGGHAAVQVKAINGLTWQFDIRKFLDVHMDADGKRQILGAPQEEPFPELVCVLVVLKETGRDRFFVLSWKQFQAILESGYKAYLEKHDFQRPKAPASFHAALRVSEVVGFEDEWRTILDRVSPSARNDVSLADDPMLAAHI